MYYIRKYLNCWAVHDDVIDSSRKLTETEVEKLKIEIPTLNDDYVLTIYTDKIRSISPAIDTYKENEKILPFTQFIASMIRIYQLQVYVLDCLKKNYGFVKHISAELSVSKQYTGRMVQYGILDLYSFLVGTEINPGDISKVLQDYSRPEILKHHSELNTI